ncbi:MAG: AgmX/PglI C-terminal domain-containing protein [Bacteriovoracaceae bacterium]|nr:AgmX/PglI C-terminal domain-containing protein [Bacteriovoracaceae bacterium]
MAKTTLCSFELRLPDGNLLSLNKEKLLIGSSSRCDIILEQQSVSAYHAMIFVNEKGVVTVMDLDSLNGVYVGGERVTGQKFIGEDDTVTFGDVHLVLEASQNEVPFAIEDTALPLVREEEKIYVPERSHENEVLIDDEYCDIVFEEDNFTPVFKSPIQGLAFEDYVESDTLEDPFDITKESNESCIMVTTLVSGIILEQSFLPLKDGEYFASGNKQGGKFLLVDVLDSKAKEPFLSVHTNHLEISNLDGFSTSQTKMDLNSKEVAVLTKGTFQIFIEITAAPKELIRLPLLVREKDFWKQAGKTFASVMLPMLLLLLVDFSIEKPKDPKKLSIIYKRPTNTQMNNKAHASKDASKTDKNNGHKKTEQNSKKVARSKAGQKASQPKKSTKVAKAQAKKSSTTKKAKAPVKAYEFKMAANINSMMNNGQSAAVAKTRSPASVASSNAITGSLNTKVTGNASAKVGNMGSDLSGAEQSFGAKGLSGKKGMDTSYIETETVVLGSMDPELLRKILQQYLPQFRHCYQQELAYNSEDIQGIVDLNFEISGAGKVGKINIRAKDSRFSNKGINCMSKVLSIINFPQPKGGGRVAVRQPLNFFSEKERS